ncbi:MAG: hypothetical protein RSD13_06065 [Clostridium sp.]
MVSLSDVDRISLVTFENDILKLSKFKTWGLCSSKSRTIPTIFYSGAFTFTKVECEVIGYLKTRLGYETVVILIGKDTHKISPEYLKDMNS